MLDSLNYQRNYEACKHAGGIHGELACFLADPSRWRDLRLVVVGYFISIACVANGNNLCGLSYPASAVQLHPLYGVGLSISAPRLLLLLLVT